MQSCYSKEPNDVSEQMYSSQNYSEIAPNKVSVSFEACGKSDDRTQKKAPRCDKE